MKLAAMALSLCGIVSASAGLAAEGPVPKGIPHLDHVFVIMMENHIYGQIVGNPNAPYINKYAKTANLATNYFAVAHPSLTNYLEVTGGSNFGVLSDNNPDWHDKACTPNLASGAINTDNPPSPAICPISGSGTDAATPAQDCTNEVQTPPCELNIDGIESIPPANQTAGMTIADQLVAAGYTWKSYQEGISPAGADLIDYSDGEYTNLTDFTQITPTLNPPLTQADIVQLYAVKHNPFAFFRAVQEGKNKNLSLKQTVAFTGDGGLYSDLASGDVPNFAFIVPNQCNDQHGRSNGTAFCNFDPDDNGTQAGLNPALIELGDVTVKTLVEAIHGSPSWQNGHNAIVLLWDENDYSTAPNINQVVVVVETNFGKQGVKSDKRYTHFSLLKTLEAAFALPCLNHACDAKSDVMADLFVQ